MFGNVIQDAAFIALLPFLFVLPPFIRKRTGDASWAAFWVGALGVLAANRLIDERWGWGAVYLALALLYAGTWRTEAAKQRSPSFGA